ncbi:hypothetical protein OIO90_004431 [Microbotryomycetes sp. JL221]|nr:hypothetical protein OIO90_004431 [Microbotryomycetes sp. JL221]
MLSEGKQELKQLLAVLTESINNLVDSDEVCIGSLHSSDPASSAPVLTRDSVMASLAASQLMAHLNGAAHGLMTSFFIHVPHCLRVVIEAHVTEVLREAGKPLHVNDIAKQARVLRLLAAHHFFKEVEQDIFVNNRCAVGLDTFKSVKDLQNTDEISKASSYLAEFLLDPSTSTSVAVDNTPWQLGHHTDKVCWEYIAQQESRVNRFASAMIAVNSFGGGIKGVTFDNGFNFKGLGTGTTLVDVGSGAGALSLVLHQTCPNINLVLQDRPEVIEGETTKTFEREVPEALKSGQIKLQPHDFFTPQPVKNADVYLMRAIIHDWPDAEALVILKHLAAAASPNSQLLVIEHVIQSLAPLPSSSTNGNGSNDKHVLTLQAPPVPYHLDLQMMCALNAQERTVEQFQTLLKKGGWNVERVGRGTPDAPCHFICKLA